MMVTSYPIGYGTQLVSMTQLRAVHEPRMHPEMARRLFPWIESMGGLIGVGGGWRATQPDRPGFAPDGKSFHQDQVFASGFVGYAAVDLVAIRPGHVHRAPTWAESDTAPIYGLHTFIKNPPEPWHMQCVEMRGWQTWVNDGRPDPHHFVLPGDTTDFPESEEDDDMAELLEFAAGDIDPAGWGPTIVVRGTGPARRVNVGELDRLKAKLGNPRRLVAGSPDHHWVALEIRYYDHMLKAVPK